MITILHPSLLAFIGIGSPGMGEMIVIGVIAVILFGGKLPEVARTLGNSYQQFRKGLSDIQASIRTEIDDNHSTGSYSTPKLNDFSDVDDYEEPTGPALEPPPEDPPEDQSASA